MNTTAVRSATAFQPLSILRLYWSRGIRCPSDASFAFSISLFWLIVYNLRFWQETIEAMWHGTTGSALFLGGLFVVVWCLQAALLLLIPSRRTMLALTSVLFVVAAASSYFASKYGIVMNKDMLRNVLETDAAESRSLLSADLIERIVLLGLLPSMIVWKVRLPAMKWSKRLRARAASIVGIAIACAVALSLSSASYAVFFREHKPIRYLLVPAAPLTSAVGVLFDKHAGGAGPLINASGTAQRTSPPHPKPLVIVMIVGETARAANFQLGGYARQTNPKLSGTPGLVYFPDTTSCGTATAVSVPCMFSHLPRRDFDVDEASRYANVLDAVQSAGLDVEWRDNNAGCKGVCARVAQADHEERRASKRCGKAQCYDEILLEDLDRALESATRDTLIVMHQIGSHGPAYFERYPPEFETFKPACRSNELQRCSPEEIVNAYDNTIVYTDHVIAGAIEALRRSSGSVDAMLLYVSDHGESLGEKGVYLHGLPYAFAPDVQKHIPMLMWFSPSYTARTGVTADCLQRRAAEPFSHDNVYHTVLGAAQVRNASYDPSLDILRGCRSALWPSDHE